jgi:hypothetical protein
MKEALKSLIFTSSSTVLHFQSTRHTQKHKRAIFSAPRYDTEESNSPSSVSSQGSKKSAHTPQENKTKTRRMSQSSASTVDMLSSMFKNMGEVPMSDSEVNIEIEAQQGDREEDMNIESDSEIGSQSILTESSLARHNSTFGGDELNLTIVTPAQILSNAAPPFVIPGGMDDTQRNMMTYMQSMMEEMSNRHMREIENITAKLRASNNQP